MNHSISSTMVHIRTTPALLTLHVAGHPKDDPHYSISVDTYPVAATLNGTYDELVQFANDLHIILQGLDIYRGELVKLTGDSQDEAFKVARDAINTMVTMKLGED